VDRVTGSISEAGVEGADAGISEGAATPLIMSAAAEDGRRQQGKAVMSMARLWRRKCLARSPILQPRLSFRLPFRDSLSRSVVHLIIVPLSHRLRPTARLHPTAAVSGAGETSRGPCARRSCDGESFGRPLWGWGRAGSAQIEPKRAGCTRQTERIEPRGGAPESGGTPAGESLGARTARLLTRLLRCLTIPAHPDRRHLFGLRLAMSGAAGNQRLT